MTKGRFAFAVGPHQDSTLKDILYANYYWFPFLLSRAKCTCASSCRLGPLGSVPMCAVHGPGSQMPRTIRSGP